MPIISSRNLRRRMKMAIEQRMVGLHGGIALVACQLLATYP
jgi:hypothetical protein